MFDINTKNTSVGFIILSITNIISKVLSLLYIPFLMRTIGQEGYGVYYAAYNIYAFVFIITISGTSSAIPKFISEYRATGHEKDAKACFRIGRTILICFGFISMLLLFLMASPLVSFVGYKKAYFAIITLCPSIFITSINSSYRGYFQGYNDMSPLGISQFVEQVGNTIFTILFAYLLIKINLELGVAGGAAGTAIGALFSLIYLLYKYKKENIVKKESKERIHTDKEILFTMINYSLPLIISAGLIYAGNNLIDVANIKNGLLKAGLTDKASTIIYGCYGNYVQVMSVPLIIISCLSLTIVPIISRFNALKDNEKLLQNIKEIFKLCLLIAIPSAIGLSILSKPIFILIFGHKYSQGSNLMVYGSFIVIFSSLFQISNTILNSLGKVYKATASALTGVIIKIASNFILIPIAYINIYGAIIGLFFTNFIPLFINSHTIKKHINTNKSIFNAWKKTLVCSLAMGLIVFMSYNIFHRFTLVLFSDYISNAISVFISIYIGIIIYAKCLVFTNNISDNEIKLIPSKFRKFLFLNHV